MFWGILGQRGWGTNIKSSVEGELQQHTDYSTLLVSPHFTCTVATNITLVATKMWKQTLHWLEQITTNITSYIFVSVLLLP